MTTVSPQVLTEFPSAERTEGLKINTMFSLQRHFELARAARMGGDDRAIVSGAAAMHGKLSRSAGGRSGLWSYSRRGIFRKLGQFLDGESRLEILHQQVEKFSLHLDQFLMHGIGNVHENRLNSLGSITDPRGFHLIDNEIAAFQDPHARARERALGIFSRDPVAVHGQLRAVTQQGRLSLGPYLPVFRAGLCRLDLRLVAEFDDLHRFGKDADLLLAFDVAYFSQNRRGIDQFGLGKCLADLLPRAVENRAFRACAFPPLRPTR